MQHLGVFGKTIDDALNKRAETMMKRGRQTIVEASLFNAIELPESDPDEGR